MSAVHLNKPEERLPFNPVTVRQLFNPVTSCCEVAVAVRSRPRIISKTDFALNGGTLHRKLGSR